MYGLVVFNSVVISIRRSTTYISGELAAAAAVVLGVRSLSFAAFVVSFAELYVVGASGSGLTGASLVGGFREVGWDGL